MRTIWKSAVALALVFWASASFAQEPQWTGNEKLRCATQGGSACEIILNEVRSVFILPYSDGTRDMTSTLQRCVDNGKICQLQTNGIYKITSQIVVTTAGAGFIGDGTAQIYMPAASFTNTSLVSSDRYGINSCGIYVHGDLSGGFTPLTGFTLKGIKVVSEVSDGRVVGAVCAKNVANFQVSNVEVYGFPIGYGIVANTISGNSFITNNYIHDFYSNAVWPSLPQSTGIAIDPDRVNGTNSYELIVASNRVIKIEEGPVPLLTWGYQTDGINFQGSGAGAAGISRGLITGNMVDTAGECIDNFGSYNIISNNHLINCKAAGLKLIHGASYCEVYGNLVDNSGAESLLVSEGSSQDTAYNHIYGNRFYNVDYENVWGAGGSNTIHGSPVQTYGIKIADGAGGFDVTHTLIENNIIDPGTYGNYDYNVDPSATDTIFRNNQEIKAGTLGYFTGSAFSIASGGGSIIPATPTLFKATITAYTVANADGTKKVPFDTVVIDSRNEYDAGNVRWKANFPGWYHVQATTFFTSATLGFEFKSNINVNGSFATFLRSWISSTGEQSFTIDAIVPVALNQYVEISDALTDPTARTVTAGAQFTTLTINQVQ